MSRNHYHEVDWVVVERLADGIDVPNACACEKRAAFELIVKRRKMRGHTLLQTDLYAVNETHLRVNGSTLAQWRKELNA